MSRKMKDNSGMEVLLFPMDYLNISQGENGVGWTSTSRQATHLGTLAIDNTGFDNGIDACYAPCKMECIQIDRKEIGNTCFFKSVNNVRLANGSIGKVTMMFIHDNDITDIVESEGVAVEDLTSVQIINQGEEFYHEGVAGYADGNHVHMEIRIDTETTSTGFYILNSYENYMLPDAAHIWDCYYVNKSTILNSRDYTFVTFNEPFNPEGRTDGLYEYNDDYFYVEDEVIKTGWVETDDARYYANPTDGKMVKGLNTISNDTYFFDETTCIMQTGWRTIDGDIYYFDPDNYGAAVTGWLTYGGEYYYFETDGIMRTSEWVNDDDGVPMYYVDSTGMRVKGWLQIAYPGSPTVYWFYFNDPNDYHITSLSVGQKASDRWIASGSD